MNQVAKNNFIDYKDLDVWKASRLLVSSIYQLSTHFPKEELYTLKNQINRSAISIPSNIAEGIGRNHLNDKIQFMHIARGSLYELETQIYLAFDQKYIDESQLGEILGQVEICKKLLNGFITYLKNKK